jgi:hypothetical protein
MAERNRQLTKELVSLKKEELDLQFIKDFTGRTEQEFELFKKENIIAFERLEFIKKRIKEIEWDLMTDKEKIIHIKYLNNLKKKFKGK